VYDFGELIAATKGAKPTYGDVMWFVQKQRREREQAAKPAPATVLDFFAEG
jgi:hypothetical protein